MNAAYSSNPEAFWSTRLAHHGHTGWADPVIYAFDQPERLNVIRSALSKLAGPRGNALDFGCGTGDFSKLLLSFGYLVCGLDPFVCPNIESERFIYAKRFTEIPFCRETLDLVLTVTSLAHLVIEEDLKKALQEIRLRLKPGAEILFTEYALDSATDAQRFGLKSDYQIFRTVSDWEVALESCGIQLIKTTPVPQPLLSPSRAYLSYRRSFGVRFFTKLAARAPFFRSLQRPILAAQAKKHLRAEPVFEDTQGRSPLKILHAIPK